MSNQDGKVSIIKIAEAWGCTRQYVNKLRMKGMPTDSIEIATEWMEAHRMKPPIKIGLEGYNDDVEKSLPEDTQAEASDLMRDDIYGCLARSKQSEKVAYAILHQAQVNRDHARLPNLVKAHKESVMGRLTAETRVEQLQRSTGQTIGTDLAKNIMSRYMSTIRALMEGLPSSVCRRANPSDPELAKEAMQEGVDRIIAIIHKTKGAFGEKVNESSLDEIDKTIKPIVDENGIPTSKEN